MRTVAALCLWASLVTVGSAAVHEAQDANSRGDAAWECRAEGQVDGVPRPGLIGESIAAYEAVLATDPGALDARWKLQRALYFRGEYVPGDAAARLSAFRRGRDLGEQGLDLLAVSIGGRRVLDALTPEELTAQLEDPRAAARVYFWTAVHWGLLGRTSGTMVALREGVARKVRDYAERVTALDETIESGGGHRLLGRLHFEAPRIPFVTGWVSKDRAVTELARAYELAPDDLLNQLYLAEALLEHEPTRRAEALALLRQIAAATPRSEYLVEDLAVVADARHLLVELGEMPN